MIRGLLAKWDGPGARAAGPMLISVLGLVLLGLAAWLAFGAGAGVAVYGVSCLLLGERLAPAPSSGGLR